MNKRSLITLILLIVVLPALAVAGLFLFGSKGYIPVALAVALLSLAPLFYAFERKSHSAWELAVLAVMIAFSALGRVVFAFLPSFKPVTAMAVIAGIYLSKEAGFITGALSAVISNFYFGQGPWTPFQMCIWGLLGLLAGLLCTPLKRSRWYLALFGALAGIVYSLGMDVFTALWMDGTLVWARYGALIVSALPVTAAYAVSNVIFLLLLTRPIGEKLTRIKVKYGLFSPRKPSE